MPFLINVRRISHLSVHVILSQKLPYIYFQEQNEYLLIFPQININMLIGTSEYHVSNLDFILKMGIHRKDRFSIFRFVKPYVHQNLCKIPFRNPSQQKIVFICISTLSRPWNNQIWSLQCLVYYELPHLHTISIYFHVYPCDTLTVHGNMRQTVNITSQLLKII